MQVLPREKSSAYKDRPPRNLLLNPNLNVVEGCRILRYSIDAFNQSLAHGLCAYNLGVQGLKNKGITSALAQAYLRAVSNTYLSLWGPPLPEDIPQYLGGVPPPPPPPPAGTLTSEQLRLVIEARWNCEEAVRTLENQSLSHNREVITWLESLQPSLHSPDLDMAITQLKHGQDAQVTVRTRLLQETIARLYRLEAS